MKKMIWGLALLGLTIGAQAGYVEVKTPGGTYGYSEGATYYPYVCYQRRVRVFQNGYQILRYEGCTRSRYSCRSIGMVHFGRYPNNRASYRALQRCINATPRFVD
jgi:hypothetical protein